MSKSRNRHLSGKSLKFISFSEPVLVVFVMIFAAIGSYNFLRSYALSETDGYPVPARVSSEEAAWLSGMLETTAILAAAGPITVFIAWWVWRRSELMLSLKLILTFLPLAVIMALV